MESHKVDLFMISNAKYFESYHLSAVREKLNSLEDEKWPLVLEMQFKNPDTMMIVSLTAGQLGIDRFMLGDTGMGVLKLITCGGFGIWAIVDWFTIMSAAREKNMQIFQNALY